MTAPQTVADVLDAAADLLTPEGAWTQGAYARHKGHTLADGRSEIAECWCTVGALEKVSGGLVGKRLTDPLYDVIGLDIHPTIIAWNDAPGRTQDEVVAALRAAATSARQGETK